MSAGSPREARPPSRPPRRLAPRAMETKLSQSTQTLTSLNLFRIIENELIMTKKIVPNTGIIPPSRAP